MIRSLEDFKTYKLAMELGERVWGIVTGWDNFLKDTIGKQMIRSVDSIAANLSEGLGRYHINETRNFSFYSRGSLFETKTWLTKANNRGLIDHKQFSDLMKDIDNVGKMINGYIKTLNKVNIVNELDPEYGI